MRIASVNVGARGLIRGHGTSMESGIVKIPVAGPVRVRALGLDGDVQVDRKHHGGADQAVYAYAAEHYAWWRGELERAEWPFGLFGENLTTEGFDDRDLAPGHRLRVGPVLLEAVKNRQPCRTLAVRFDEPKVLRLMVNSGRLGWYYRVLEEGEVRAGDRVEVLA